METRVAEWKNVGGRILVRCPECTLMSGLQAATGGGPVPGVHVLFDCPSCKHSETLRLPEPGDPR